ncbi:MAG TPA: hypothetical protein VLX44_02020 [Xanthobacteraceae bacterium]|nr:hypothetical protein [Xanthobacteraceae bacterium]
MTDLAASSPVSRRADLELLSQQRRKAELRLARERARNARVGIAGVVVLAVLLVAGVQTGWVPIGHATPSDEQAREFAATRVGHVLLPTGDDETCRVLAFQNDTGRFSQGPTVRCADAMSATIDQVATDANGRALSIRAWFAKR